MQTRGKPTRVNVAITGVRADELRQLTAEAIAADQQKKLSLPLGSGPLPVGQEGRLGDLVELRERRRQLQIQTRRAERIVAEIPRRVRMAANTGTRRAVVMEGLTDRVDYDRPPTTCIHRESCEPEWLKPDLAARFVWDACVEAKLNPSFGYRRNGVGQSCFDIVVHW